MYHTSLETRETLKSARVRLSFYDARLWAPVCVVVVTGVTNCTALIDFKVPRIGERQIVHMLWEWGMENRCTACSPPL